MTDFSDLIMRRPATPDRPLQGQTVLVVEDSRFACEALRLLCQRSGARIRRADTITAARRHLQTYRPSIVIVDLGLPDGDGAQLIADLASATPRIPVIVGMSGDDGAAERAATAGADAFLAKPIASLAAFQDTLRAAMPNGLETRADDEAIEPDRLAVRDDLARVAAALAAPGNEEQMDYLIQFLSGVARSANDFELADALTSLARHRASCQPTDASLARVAALIRARLSEYDAFAA